MEQKKSSTRLKFCNEPFVLYIRKLYSKVKEPSFCVILYLNVSHENEWIKKNCVVLMQLW